MGIWKNFHFFRWVGVWGGVAGCDRTGRQSSPLPPKTKCVSPYIHTLLKHQILQKSRLHIYHPGSYVPYCTREEKLITALPRTGIYIHIRESEDWMKVLYMYILRTCTLDLQNNSLGHVRTCRPSLTYLVRNFWRGAGLGCAAAVSSLKKLLHRWASVLLCLSSPPRNSCTILFFFLSLRPNQRKNKLIILLISMQKFSRKKGLRHLWTFCKVTCMQMHARGATGQYHKHVETKGGDGEGKRTCINQGTYVCTDMKASERKASEASCM